MKMQNFILLAGLRVASSPTIQASIQPVSEPSTFFPGPWRKLVAIFVPEHGLTGKAEEEILSLKSSSPACHVTACSAMGIVPRKRCSMVWMP